MNTQSDSGINTVTTTDPVENGWRGLFVLTEHWQADLKFYAHELQFFGILLDRHFTKLIDEEHLESAKAAVSKMTKLENRRISLERKLERHYHHMASLIEDPFPHDGQSYRDEHGKLEAAIRDFVKDFRLVKTEVFRLAKQVMDGERTGHLLTR